MIFVFIFLSFTNSWVILPLAVTIIELILGDSWTTLWIHKPRKSTHVKNTHYQVLKPVIHDHLLRLLGPSVSWSQIQSDGWKCLKSGLHTLTLYGNKRCVDLHKRGLGGCTTSGVYMAQWSLQAGKCRNISYRMYRCITVEGCVASLCIFTQLNGTRVSHKSSSKMVHNKPRFSVSTRGYAHSTYMWCSFWFVVQCQILPFTVTVKSLCLIFESDYSMQLLYLHHFINCNGELELHGKLLGWLWGTEKENRRKLVFNLFHVVFTQQSLMASEICKRKHTAYAEYSLYL